MASLPSKRRKIGHDEPSLPTNGNSEPVQERPGQESSSNEPVVAKPQTVQSKPKRAQEDDDNAIYAGGLYKSSMFKLQVDEMLSEIRPKYEKRMSGVDDALRRLKGLIEGIEDREPLSVRLAK